VQVGASGTTTYSSFLLVCGTTNASNMYDMEIDDVCTPSVPRIYSRHIVQAKKFNQKLHRCKTSFEFESNVVILVTYNLSFIN
jgi:hypothetical protein